MPFKLPDSPVGIAIERLHKFADNGWGPRLAATTTPDVVELEHIKVCSTTLFMVGLVTVRGFEGHADTGASILKTMSRSLRCCASLGRLRAHSGR